MSELELESLSVSEGLLRFQKQCETERLFYCHDIGGPAMDCNRLTFSRAYLMALSVCQVYSEIVVKRPNIWARLRNRLRLWDGEFFFLFLSRSCYKKAEQFVESPLSKYYYRLYKWIQVLQRAVSYYNHIAEGLRLRKVLLGQEEFKQIERSREVLAIALESAERRAALYYWLVNGEKIGTVPLPELTVASEELEGAILDLNALLIHTTP